MSWLEALILGIIQGLTEFLPVSSSGHLEIGKEIFGITSENSLIFTILVHGATVLSTIIIFRKDIAILLQHVIKLRWNEENKYVIKILISMIPVAILGFFFKENIESIFESKDILRIVGICLIVTAALLTITYYKQKNNKNISFIHSFIIGIAQAFAVLPGISRSGATIATGLLLGIRKELIAKFAFLMVLIPIIGENILDLYKGEMTKNAEVSTNALFIGFIAAFITGLLACKFMLNIVKRGKLIYFAIYCFFIGTFAFIYSFYF